ncbi:hypothetical protein QTP88_024539 [Uroleucon formosanum]
MILLLQVLLSQSIMLAKYNRSDDNVLARDYWNNNNKWQKGKIIKYISYNMHDIELDEELIWKRHNDQLLIDKSSTPSSNSISFTPAGQTNKNLKNSKTIGTSYVDKYTIIIKLQR